MLEVINAAGVIRQGEAKLEFSSAYQGYITYIKGVDYEGTVIITYTNDSAQASKSYYPIKKLRFEEDLSDTADAVDKIARNARVVYYEGGEFITDRFSRQSLAFGRVVPATTAQARGSYGVDIVVTTVVPTQALYVNYLGDHRGQLTASAMGTAVSYTNPPKKFRLIQAWAATAAISATLNVDSERSQIRFKVVPGYVGEQF